MQKIAALDRPTVKILVPRRVEADLNAVGTFAQAVAARSPQPAALLSPLKNSAATLRKIGLQQAKLFKLTGLPRVKGVFTRLEALGLIAAEFATPSQEANAMEELADHYVFIPDFPVSLPGKIRLDAGKDTSTPGQQQWPIESGIAQAHAAGIRGEGVLVGVLDTGIDADHEEFSHTIVNYRYVSPNPLVSPSRDVRGFDVGGHGTHVSGILAGKTLGVAPAAKLYVAAVAENESTQTTFNRVLFGLSWLLEQFSQPENRNLPAILNMSLGFASVCPEDIAPEDYEQQINLLKLSQQTILQANVLPISAIGNDGERTYRYPAAFLEHLGVGAIDYAGKVIDFSGSCDAVQGGQAKPDLVGYGHEIYSCVGRDSVGRSLYDHCSGTSMAAPYVSGIATLYRSQYPWLSVAAVRQMLIDTALPLPDQPQHRVGYGLARFKL
jgi:subtilisin family serine protease